MKEFAGRIAVVTGGGSGMGRELVRQPVAEACNVAMCDVSAEGMAETRRLCDMAGVPPGPPAPTRPAALSGRAPGERGRDQAAARHQTHHDPLPLNTAGI